MVIRWLFLLSSRSAAGEIGRELWPPTAELSLSASSCLARNDS